MKKRINLILGVILLGLAISFLGAINLVNANNGILSNKQKRKASNMINEYRELAQASFPDETGKMVRVHKGTQEFQNEIVEEMLKTNKVNAIKLILLGVFLILGIILVKLILRP